MEFFRMRKLGNCHFLSFSHKTFCIIFWGHTHTHTHRHCRGLHLIVRDILRSFCWEWWWHFCWCTHTFPFHMQDGQQKKIFFLFLWYDSILKISFLSYKHNLYFLLKIQNYSLGPKPSSVKLFWMIGSAFYGSS